MNSVMESFYEGEVLFGSHSIYVYLFLVESVNDEVINQRKSANEEQHGRRGERI